MYDIEVLISKKNCSPCFKRKHLWSRKAVNIQPWYTFCEIIEALKYVELSHVGLYICYTAAPDVRTHSGVQITVALPKNQAELCKL